MKLRKFIPVITVLGAVISVYAAEIKWSGEITVSRTVKIERPNNLKIAPESVIKFVGKGRLICLKNRISADRVLFSADTPVRGISRIEFKNVSAVFTNCKFKGTITKKKRFHNAFFTILNGNNFFKNNRFENCSTIEFVRSKDVVFKRNIFKDCSSGLVLFHSASASIKNNSFRNCKGRAILLNATKNCLVVDNRIFKSGVGISIYRHSNDNKIIGNSVFDGNYGLSIRGSPSRNIFSVNLMDSCRVALRIWGTRPDNKISNCVFWNCGRGIECKKIKGKITILLQNSVISNSRTSTGFISSNGLIMKNNLLWNNKKGLKLADAVKISKKGNIKEVPLFKNAATGDFRPQKNSPLIGAGVPAGTNIGLFP